MTPAIQHLSLENLVLHWKTFESQLLKDDNTTFQNLLTLHFAKLDPPPSAKIFNRNLASSQGPQFLDIYNSLPNGFDPTCRWPDASSLTELRLSGHLMDIGKTLLWITSMPVRSDLRLLITTTHEHPRTSPPSGAHAESMLTLASHVVNRLSTIINTSCQTHYSDKALWINQHSSHFSVALVDVDQETLAVAPIYLKIDYLRPSFSDASFSILRSVCVPNALSVRLTIRTSDLCSLEDWRQFLTNHPRIETLELTGITRFQSNRLIEVLRLLSSPL